MRKKLHKILVTGGAGFIGSEFVRQFARAGYQVAVADKLTYAADLARLSEVKGKIRFYQADICSKKKMEEVLSREKPGAIVHFAAETHVDRSIVNSDPFIDTNIRGTKVLCDAARKFEIPRFLHVSTDEVYGEIEAGRFSEASPLSPNSPYAASKAAADLLVKSYIRTYGFPAIIVRPSNNYGPWQYPEKLIPLTILRATRNLKVPVYARGQNRREWLYVSDCAQAIGLILQRGKIGEVYNAGSGQERMNIDVVKSILRHLSRPQALIAFVKDRPGHDLRYALNSGRLNQLGWKAKINFKDGIEKTARWYMQNAAWLQKHYSKKLSIQY